MRAPSPAPQAKTVFLCMELLRNGSDKDKCIKELGSLALNLESHAAALSEENERLKREVGELNRRLEEQHKLYCEETKRHNETWAKIHAAMAHLNNQFKKLPEELVDAVKEVTFRCAIVEMGRDQLRDSRSRDADRIAWILANAEVSYNGNDIESLDEMDALIGASHPAATNLTEEGK